MQGTVLSVGETVLDTRVDPVLHEASSLKGKKALNFGTLGVNHGIHSEKDSVETSTLLTLTLTKQSCKWWLLLERDTTSSNYSELNLKKHLIPTWVKNKIFTQMGSEHMVFNSLVRKIALFGSLVISWSSPW